MRVAISTWRLIQQLNWDMIATPRNSTEGHGNATLDRKDEMIKEPLNTTNPARPHNLANGSDGESRDAAGMLSSATLEEAIPPDDTFITAKHTKTKTFMIVVALCSSVLLAALDSTIITTAAPTITAHFNSNSGYVWIGSAYLLGNAASIPSWGELSGIFGRKPTLLLAIAIFLLGSLLCGVSQSISMMIAARALQGVGSDGAVVLPNLCMSDLFSLRQRGMYFGIFGLVWAVASGLGPVLGGVFTDKVTWRWCFFINLPIGGVALLVLAFFLDLHNPRTPIKQGLAAIDWLGTLLVIGSTLMTLIGLEFGGVEHPWKSATVICLLVSGIATLGIFFAYEAFLAEFPVIPVGLFRHRTNAASYALSALHAVSFTGGSYWLPLYFQSVLRATPLLSGVYLLPFVLSLSTCSILAGVAIKKSGIYRPFISGGFLVSTLGYGLFTYLGPDRLWERVIPFQVIAGVGTGPNFQAPLIALQSNFEQRDVGAATASFAFVRQIGNAISVTIGGVVLNNAMQGHNLEFSSVIGPETAAMFSGNSAAANAGTVRTIPDADAQTVSVVY